MTSTAKLKNMIMTMITMMTMMVVVVLSESSMTSGYVCGSCEGDEQRDCCQCLRLYESHWTAKQKTSVTYTTTASSNTAAKVATLQSGTAAARVRRAVGTDLPPETTFNPPKPPTTTATTSTPTTITPNYYHCAANCTGNISILNDTFNGCNVNNYTVTTFGPPGPNLAVIIAPIVVGSVLIIGVIVGVFLWRRRRRRKREPQRLPNPFESTRTFGTSQTREDTSSADFKNNNHIYGNGTANGLPPVSTTRGATNDQDNSCKEQPATNSREHSYINGSRFRELWRRPSKERKRRQKRHGEQRSHQQPAELEKKDGREELHQQRRQQQKPRREQQLQQQQPCPQVDHELPEYSNANELQHIRSGCNGETPETAEELYVNEVREQEVATGDYSYTAASRTRSTDQLVQACSTDQLVQGNRIRTPQPKQKMKSKNKKQEYVNVELELADVRAARQGQGQPVVIRPQLPVNTSTTGAVSSRMYGEPSRGNRTSIYPPSDQEYPQERYVPMDGLRRPPIFIVAQDEEMSIPSNVAAPAGQVRPSHASPSLVRNQPSISSSSAVRSPSSQPSPSRGRALPSRAITPNLANSSPSLYSNSPQLLPINHNITGSSQNRGRQSPSLSRNQDRSCQKLDDSRALQPVSEDSGPSEDDRYEDMTGIGRSGTMEPAARRNNIGSRGAADPGRTRGRGWRPAPPVAQKPGY